MQYNIHGKGHLGEDKSYSWVSILRTIESYCNYFSCSSINRFSDGTPPGFDSVLVVGADDVSIILDGCNVSVSQYLPRYRERRVKNYYDEFVVFNQCQQRLRFIVSLFAKILKLKILFIFIIKI